MTAASPLGSADGRAALLVSRGLAQQRAWARSPAVVVQLLLGLTAFSLLQTLPAVAVGGLVLAAVVLSQLVLGARGAGG